MTKLFLILFVSLISITILGQGNAISVTYSYDDMGLGGRYDHQYFKWGFYSSGQYGTYYDKNYGDLGHAKLAIGATRYIQSPYADVTSMYFAGLSGHYYKTIEEGLEQLNSATLFPVSFEFGAGIVICDHLQITLCYDPFKKYVTSGLGYAW